MVCRGNGAADLAPQVARWFRGGPDFDRTIAARFGPGYRGGRQGAAGLWGRVIWRPAGADPAARPVRPQCLARLAPCLSVRRARRVVAPRGASPASAADRALAPLERGILLYALAAFRAVEISAARRSPALERLLAEAPPDCLPHFRQSVARARRYRAIIFWFGRFPHRNAILGRQSTFPERVFLAALALRRRAAGLPARFLGLLLGAVQTRRSAFAFNRGQFGEQRLQIPIQPKRSRPHRDGRTRCGMWGKRGDGAVVVRRGRAADSETAR